MKFGPCLMFLIFEFFYSKTDLMCLDGVSIPTVSEARSERRMVRMNEEARDKQIDKNP